MDISMWKYTMFKDIKSIFITIVPNLKKWEHLEDTILANPKKSILLGMQNFKCSV